MVSAVAWRWRIDAVDRLKKGYLVMCWRSAVCGLGKGLFCRAIVSGFFIFIVLLNAGALSPLLCGI
jgi:hypothetical protein